MERTIPTAMILVFIGFPRRSGIYQGKKVGTDNVPSLD